MATPCWVEKDFFFHPKSENIIWEAQGEAWENVRRDFDQQIFPWPRKMQSPHSPLCWINATLSENVLAYVVGLPTTGLFR